MKRLPFCASVLLYNRAWCVGCPCLLGQYLRLRQECGPKDGAPSVTVRQLEGLVRLSEALAKMQLSPKVGLLSANHDEFAGSYITSQLVLKSLCV